MRHYVNLNGTYIRYLIGSDRGAVSDPRAGFPTKVQSSGFPLCGVNPQAQPNQDTRETMAKRILVVDDHAPTRALVRSILDAEKSETFAVVEAGSGAECLKAADRHGPFDLILLDVNLPDMDGYAVCKALRTVDTSVPIVFVTAMGELKDYAAGRSAGGDSYLVKPIARASLRSIVSLFTSIARHKGSAAEEAKASRQ
jgi:CheY-like chemotaxis protein